MKVFISWSGSQSHAVALILRSWLPRVIQQTRPWVSSEDINKGAGWLAEINAELQTTTRGIVCVTPGNEHAPWLNYEAGALTKETGHSRVCVALLGVESTDLTGPLRNFQATKLTDRDDVLRLLMTLNSDLDVESRLDKSLLEHSFNREWDALLEELGRVLADAEQPGPTPRRRLDRELMEETLDLVRSLARRQAGPDTATSRGREVLLNPAVGDKVRHESFGIGEIISVDGAADKTVLAVEFGDEGVKRLLLKYAPLTYATEAALPLQTRVVPVPEASD